MVGDTAVFGVLHLPADRGEEPFPLLVDVYGGPHSQGFDQDSTRSALWRFFWALLR